MGFNSIQGRAFTDPSAPEPFGICDRCNFRYLLSDLEWQHDYRGNTLKNLRILVCKVRCLDMPQDQFRPIVVPPDPVPVQNPRPGFYAQQEGPAPTPQSVVNLLYGPNFITDD